MKKRLLQFFIFNLPFIAILSASAAVPLPWTVETSRVQPASFDAYHGEALEFIARFNTVGKPLALDSHTATLYYQTNGMDQAWWSVPASVSGNVARATFTPAMDPCAPKIVVFIGLSDGPSNLNYRATANVRFLNSPGANPGWIEPPVVKLDFSQIETLNAPWFTKDESNGRYFTKTETNTKIASATNGLESAAHAAQTYQVKGQYLTSESDPTVDGKIEAHDESSSAHGDIRTAIAGKQSTISDLATIRSGAAAGATAVQPAAISDMETRTHAAQAYQPAGQYLTNESDPTVDAKIASAISPLETSAHAAQTYQPKGSYLTTESDPSVSSWAKATTKPSYTWSEIGSKPSWIGSSKPSYDWSEIGSRPTIPTDSTVSGWGYIKSYTETDPTVVSKIAAATNSLAATSDSLYRRKYSSRPAQYASQGNGQATLQSEDDILLLVPSGSSAGWNFWVYPSTDGYMSKSFEIVIPYVQTAGTVHIKIADEPNVTLLYTTSRPTKTTTQTALVSSFDFDVDAGKAYHIFGYKATSSYMFVDYREGTDYSLISDTDPAIDAINQALSTLTNSTLPSISSSCSALANTVTAWQTYWSGDDVRVTVTNYYGSQDLPSLYLEQKISEGGTNYFKTIWTEKARLNLINDRLDDLEADVETKADRAWGFYDSHSGTWAPDGFTSISSGSILISKDMSYQKNITSGGEVWVLTSNDPTVISGTETNGFFKIADSEGNSIFEVVKGDKRVVPATVSAVSAGGNSLTINFNVVSSDHPSIEICSDLVEADWKAEDEASCPATVAWSGSSGNYVATVTGKAAMPKMFVKGTYEVGGETYIKNAAPIGFEKVVIGGVYYRVTVETVSGRKLMVLTEL